MLRKLPVIVHSRDAFEDTLECINNIGYHNGIIHCYSYGIEEARTFLDLGWYIALGGGITYTKKSKLEQMQELIRFIPSDRLLTETDAPYLADKLYQLKTQIWNEALTKLGIANVNTQKKERLVQDEVGVTTASAVASRLSRKKARQQGADKINQMFGTKITVDFNPDLLMSNESEDEDGQNENDNQKKGGEDNE